RRRRRHLRHQSCGPSRPGRTPTPCHIGRRCPRADTFSTRNPRRGEAVTIRILLADDQHLIRAGLAALLNLEEDLDVVAQLPDGTGVVEAIREHTIDVAVLDIEMPDVDGITATGQITQAFGADVAVLILTTF